MVWLVFVLNSVPLALMAAFFVMWDAKFRPVWFVADRRSDLNMLRTLGEVWTDWHARSWFCPIEWAFFGTLAVILGGALLLTFLHLPRMHRTGPLLQSAHRTFAATVAAGGALTITGVLVGDTIVMIDLTGTAFGIPISGDWRPFPATIAIPLAIHIVLRTISAAIAGVQDEDVLVELPPRCESCGYDLTHRAAHSRCTECGESVDASLKPNLRRPGTAWQVAGETHAPSIDVLARTTIDIIQSPTAYYTQLKLRSAYQAAMRFAFQTHFAGIIWGLALGLVALASQRLSQRANRLQWSDVEIFMGLFGLWLPLVVWALHHGVAVVVLLWWTQIRLLPDYRWATQVQAYETAYGWMLWAFWTLATVSFLMFGQWLTGNPIFGFTWQLFGMPPEPVVLFGGTMTIVMLWLWRYALIGRAIRWSDF